MAKALLKIKARKFRQGGESIKVIAKILDVSTSTVSKWCEDIVLSANQTKELERRAHDPLYGKRLQYTAGKRQERIDKTNKLLHEGISEVGDLSPRDLFIAGIALYWAEGFKSDNLAGFCNSDPDMVKIFLSWLKQCFGYKNDDFRLRVGLNIGYLNKTKEIERYWSRLTNVPLSQFQKPFYQKVKWQKVYEHPENYHGVLRIRIKKSTDFLRKLKGYIEGIKLSTAG